MKKLIAFFSAVTFLGSSVLAVSACGVSKGQIVKVEINNAPKKAENGQDPLIDYIYNDKYSYNSGSVVYLTALAAQLASDKIYYDNEKTLNSDDWKELYRSTEWQEQSFSSFNYELAEGVEGFSFQANNDQDLIYQISNNDSTVDNNKLRIYWFITSAEPWNSEDSESFNPTKENITVPGLSEFDDNNVITDTGWLHFYLKIGTFRIDFSIEINFIFNKVFDKNDIPVVVLNLDTFAKPFGDIKFDDREEAAKTKVVNLSVKKETPIV